MSDPDLSLVDTSNLLRTLLDRFDHAAFIGMRVNEGGHENHSYHRSWKGNRHTCLGLLEDLQVVIVHNFHADSCPLVQSEDE